MPCWSHSAQRQRIHGLGADDVEAAFALHRLDDDGRDAAGLDVGLEGSMHGLLASSSEVRSQGKGAW
jgi:hypothetical protein